MQIGNLILVGLSAFIFTISSAIAGTKPHTWHLITTDNGIWDGRLQMINEEGFFTDRDGSPLTKFTISPNKSQEYGFSFGPEADFDIAYTLTLTQRDTKNFNSKTCVYVITASGPANPDIRPSSYNGAQCDWKIVPGQGEDFFVS
jgi:hypothetical protein